MINFNPFPIIETENLILRKMKDSDKYNLFEMRSNLSIHKYTDTIPDKDINETEDYIDKMVAGIDRNEWIVWAIEYKASNKVIGMITIWNIDKKLSKGELGYTLNPDYQGKGLMKETLLHIIDYGFNTMILSTLEAYTEKDNFPSNQLLKGINFEYTDHLDEPGKYSDRTYHMNIYILEKKNT